MLGGKLHLFSLAEVHFLGCFATKVTLISKCNITVHFYFCTFLFDLYTFIRITSFLFII